MRVDRAEYFVIEWQPVAWAVMSSMKTGFTISQVGCLAICSSVIAGCIEVAFATSVAARIALSFRLINTTVLATVEFKGNDATLFDASAAFKAVSYTHLTLPTILRV